MCWSEKPENSVQLGGCPPKLMLTRKGRAFSTQLDKLEFIKARPELWDKSEKFIKARLVEAGLCSKKTYPADLGLWRYLKKLRGE